MNYKYLLTSMLAVAGISAAVSAQNPIISAVYTPDPAPYVHGDKLYLFTDHDEDDATYFLMKDWLVFSTEDMVNWTYLGAQVSTATFDWAAQGDKAWASQAVERNGTTSITKVGTGLWRLTGANTYSGVTSINGGTLIVNGKNSGKGAMTVADGATLKGKGSITGKVTVYGGGTLCPGDDAVDGSKLTTKGGLALKSGSKLIIPVAEGEDGALILNGISVSGAISIDEGACLEIDLSRLSDHKFKRGDALPIIKDATNITSGAGSFTIYPATPGEGLEWETSTLFTDGMLRVKKEGEIFSGGGITTQHYEATLDHTASVQGGSNEAGKFIDLESHYYNNWGSTSWAAQAYAQFSFDIPAGEEVTKAEFTFTANCGGRYDDRALDIWRFCASDTSTLMCFSTISGFGKLLRTRGLVRKTSTISSLILASSLPKP